MKPQTLEEFIKEKPEEINLFCESASLYDFDLMEPAVEKALRECAEKTVGAAGILDNVITDSDSYGFGYKNCMMEVRYCADKWLGKDK